MVACRRPGVAGRASGTVRDSEGRALAEVLFEIRRVGNALQVNAIDPVTRVEVSVTGDARAGPEAIKRVAMRKLAYVIEKKKAAGELG